MEFPCGMKKMNRKFVNQTLWDIPELTCVIGTVDDGAHGQTEGDAELSARGTSSTCKGAQEDQYGRKQPDRRFAECELSIQTSHFSVSFCVNQT